MGDERLVTEYRADGPTGGVDRAVLLAHGAGGDWDSPQLAVFAEALAEAGFPVVRFRYPYRTAGRKAPDPAARLHAATREAAAEAARRTGLPAARVVVGGRSMGGRYASLAVADAADPLLALGLLVLGYPLHPAGRPERERADHFERLDLPVLFVSGERDALAPLDRLRSRARRIPGQVAFWVVPDGDHAFRPRQRSGQTESGVLAAAAGAVVEWVRARPPP